ncbi:MAG TPA: hypothetical protein VM531_09025 [Sphingomicrobium sp.]|jgi:hypothetical protein|nr:hypothetical protein [Sphingomicrobium sp.]
MKRKRLDPKEAVKRLDALTGGDPEAAHGAADEILLETVPEEVKKAYDRLVARCGWWACA